MSTQSDTGGLRGIETTIAYYATEGVRKRDDKLAILLCKRIIEELDKIGLIMDEAIRKCEESKNDKR